MSKAREQGHRAPGKQSSGLFSVVRAPGKLSGGEFLARTGRQTPVDGAGRPLGTGIVAAARSDASIGTENTAPAFPVPSTRVLRIPLYQRTLSCNPSNAKQHYSILRAVAQTLWILRDFHSRVPALPVPADSHKGRACPPDWESIHASQEIRVARRVFPRPLPHSRKILRFCATSFTTAAAFPP